MYCFLQLHCLSAHVSAIIFFEFYNLIIVNVEIVLSLSQCHVFIFSITYHCPVGEMPIGKVIQTLVSLVFAMLVGWVDVNFAALLFD